MKPVTDMRTLKGMEKKGLILLHRDTGKEVGGMFGGTHKAKYIDDIAQGVKQPFEYHKKLYRTKYIDGCFCPYVFELGKGE